MELEYDEVENDDASAQTMGPVKRQLDDLLSCQPEDLPQDVEAVDTMLDMPSLETLEYLRTYT